jgi:hypothetical protein
MIVTDEILNEWSFRCHDGVVDLNDPKKVRILKEILDENGINLLAEDQDDDLTNIFTYLGNDKSLTKVQVFDKLAEYTQKYFSSEMGELMTVFPEIVNTINDWRREELVPERESNIGKEVETCLINYSNKVKGVQASDIANKGRGQDAVIGGKIVEIKSSKGNTINTQLQTTWYSPTKFYAFVTNTSSDSIEVRIVYGKILIELSLGQELASISNLDEMGDKLELQIKDGLTKLDFANMIKTSLVTKDPVDRETSFKIGNRLKVRFVIYFEPAYGKERGKKNEELDEDYYEEEN